MKTLDPYWRWERFDFPAESAILSCPVCFAETRFPINAPRGMLHQCPHCPFRGEAMGTEEAQRQYLEEFLRRERPGEPPSMQAQQGQLGNAQKLKFDPYTRTFVPDPANVPLSGQGIAMQIGAMGAPIAVKLPGVQCSDPGCLCHRPSAI